MENNSKWFNYVIYALFAVSLVLTIFMYSELTKEKELQNGNSTKETGQVECKKEVCTYGRYGIDYSDEETKFFKTEVYRHVYEVKDSGNVVGYYDSTLRLNNEDKTYVLEIGPDISESIFIKGSWDLEDNDTVYILKNENYFPEGEQFPLSFEFKLSDYGASLMYTGKSIPGYSLKNGDVFYFVWNE